MNTAKNGVVPRILSRRIDLENPLWYGDFQFIQDIALWRGAFGVL